MGYGAAVRVLSVLAEPHGGVVDDVPSVFRFLNQSVKQELVVEQKAWSDVQRRDLRVMQQQLPGINVTLGDAPMGMSGFLIYADSYRECPCSDMKDSPTCGWCNGVPCIDLYHSNDTPRASWTSCCIPRPSGYNCNVFRAGGGCGSVCCKSKAPDGQRATLCGPTADAVCCAPRLGHVYNCGIPIKKGKRAIDAQVGCCVRRDAPQWEMIQQGCCQYGLGYNCQDAQRGVTSICCLSHKYKYNRRWPLDADEFCQPPADADRYNATLACAKYVTYTPTRTLPADLGSAYRVGAGLLVGVFMLLCGAMAVRCFTSSQAVASRPAAVGRREAFCIDFYWFDPGHARFVMIDEDDSPYKLPDCVTLECYTKAIDVATSFSINGVEGKFDGALVVLGDREELPQETARSCSCRLTPCSKPELALHTGEPRLARLMAQDGAIGIDGRSGSVVCQEWFIGAPHPGFEGADTLAHRGLRHYAASAICTALQGKSGSVALCVSQDCRLCVLISSELLFDPAGVIHDPEEFNPDRPPDDQA
eukprot:TRINITY_DN7581_c0_g1_i2.p1 TRINITY_DN7581_c0_g1~~TRINITY_DN7581_c0_g1_i2.p1  ORF type:complete len:532 (+),score=51.82 TRINITY_DN7581_c0_g1_i2:105-1700(+)